MSGESTNANARRVREGWYDRYAHYDANGLDVGSEPDPIHPGSTTWRRWNADDGDAAVLAGVPADTYDAVYASHILEDVSDPVEALETWFRVTAPGGYLIVCVPHRDLYERRLTLPSQFNGAHKWFYLPDRTEAPCTRSLYHDYRGALRDMAPVFTSLRVLDEGWEWRPPEYHAGGEYSIELICRKPKLNGH